MQVSEALIEAIKDHEGLELEAYLCPTKVWTIGYGSTMFEGKPVKKGMKITQTQAEAQLRRDVATFAAGVDRLVTVPMSQGQLDALTSFAYNLGLGALKDSTLLELMNKGDIKGAAAQFSRWNKAKGKALPGLTKRRRAERELFLKK